MLGGYAFFRLVPDDCRVIDSSIASNIQEQLESVFARGLPEFRLRYL